jgi:hypothetical protein
MERSSYVEDWIRYWGNIGTGYASRMQRASQDARRGRYTPNRLFSDAVALWAEGVEAWCAAVAGRGVREPAVILFHLSYHPESLLRTIRIPVPGDSPPQATDLTRVGGGPVIPRSHVKIVVSSLRDELTVKLIDLPPYIPEGQYMGVIHSDDRPLVLIHAIAEAAPGARP